MTKQNMPAERLLDVENVQVHFPMREGLVKAVDGVSYHVNKGEVLGIVGESGSGKSITARAIMRLLPKRAVDAGGRVQMRLNTGEDLELSSFKRNSRAIRQVRGKHVGMIFQEPMTALSPVHTIGAQIMRTVQLHMGLSRAAARERAIDLLAKVQMPRPTELVDAFPHQLSGGMRQRAMIALAISCNPSLLIADEPTTALDVTTEAQILELLKQLQSELGMAIIFITHNFGDVPGPYCRNGDSGRHFLRAQASLYSGAAAFHSTPWCRSGTAAPHHSGHGARSLQRAERLLVQSTL